MCTLKFFLPVTFLFSLTALTHAQQPAANAASLPPAGTNPVAAAPATGVVNSESFKLGDRLRAAREARAGRRNGLLGRLRNRRRQGSSTPAAGAPAPTQR